MNNHQFINLNYLGFWPIAKCDPFSFPPRLHLLEATAAKTPGLALLSKSQEMAIKDGDLVISYGGLL